MSKLKIQCGGDDGALFAFANDVQLAKKCDPSQVTYY